MLSLNNKTILVTGGAGFIGYHVIKRLFADTPDMAYYSFTEKLLRGETIQIFNYNLHR